MRFRVESPMVQQLSDRPTARIDGADVMYALYHTVHTTTTSHRDLGGLSMFRGTRAEGVASGKVAGLLDHLPGPSPFGKNTIDIGIETNRVIGLFTAFLSQSLGQHEKPHY
jgi:hypothetical protein